MKKKLKLVLAVVAVLTAGYGSYKTYSVFEANDRSNLMAEDVEAQADLSEWWNRKDWVCDPIHCFLYDAQAPKKVADGTGDEAHSWCCVTCQDTMK